MITVNLDPAVVQNWINNPNSNQGLLLRNETPGAIVRIAASENAAAALRPKLNVTYSVGTSLAPSVVMTNSSLPANTTQTPKSLDRRVVDELLASQELWNPTSGYKVRK